MPVVINTVVRAQGAANRPRCTVQQCYVWYGATPFNRLWSIFIRRLCGIYSAAYERCGTSYSIHYTNSVVTNTLEPQERTPSPKCATYLRSSIRSRRSI